MSEGGEGEAVGEHCSQGSPTWEDGSLMNGARAVQVTLTKR